jgi:hypothetical protein
MGRFLLFLSLLLFLFLLSKNLKNLGGENVQKDKRIACLLRDKFKIHQKIGEPTDIRKNPSIKLQTILVSLFLMPFFSLTSLLSLDRESRTKTFKGLFGCKRKMVASDSTFRRVLGWLHHQQISAFLLSFLLTFEKENLLQRKLVAGATSRRLGILDGTHMGGHWLVALCLTGKINYPAITRPYRKKGDELATSRKIIKDSTKLLGPTCPNLWLLDGLYFNRNIFKDVRNQHSHLLIKVEKAHFREVLRDAENLFQHFGGDLEKKGFDSQRMCSWKIEQTTDTFAGYPVQIVHLIEFYPKRKKNRHLQCWIITTDLTLSLAEIREAAHLRWQIENNIFKRISHLSATKRFYFKDPRPFFNLLHIFFATVAVFDAIIYILRRDEELFKYLLDGIKPTWRNIFSQLKEGFNYNIFGFI